MARILSILLIILLFPLFLILALIVIIDDGFPVFFKQQRVGKFNRRFTIYKFRTMKKKTPDIATHLLKSDKFAYTKTGPFLRKYSLDEIPQLLNIFKNDITYIGPRPALHNQNDLIQMRTLKGIDKLKPGITGWAQVNGRDSLSISEKVDLDFYYMVNKSHMLDLKILMMTFLKVIKAEDVSS